MSTIAVIGATGYAGGHITAEALRRGHQVIAVSRTVAAEAGSGLRTRTGSIADAGLVEELAREAAVVVVAVHAGPAGGPLLADVVPGLLETVGRHGARLGIVGGAGSLLVAPGGPMVLAGPQFPEAAKPEAAAHARLLEVLRVSDSPTDWFYLSPAALFGSFAPGERTGSFRVGDDVLVVDADGRSAISGADFAIAFVDEIDEPAHHRARFTVGY